MISHSKLDIAGYRPGAPGAPCAGATGAMRPSCGRGTMGRGGVAWRLFKKYMGVEPVV